MVKRKQSTSAQTPPGTANSIQGIAVKGNATAESATHPVLIWVVA